MNRQPSLLQPSRAPEVRPGRAASAAGVETEAPLPVASRLPFNFARIPLHAPPIQRKPTVSSPGDSHEREADEVADKVMRMVEPAPIGSAPAAIQRQCATCEDDDQRTIQTKRAPPVNAEAALDAGAAVRAAERGGEPLPSALRSYFEPRFGLDFGRVRVHADGESATAARAVQARAYTVGHDIVFGSGEYAPATAEGKRLLAHELTHVAQQGQAPARSMASAPASTGSAAPQVQRAASGTLVQRDIDPKAAHVDHYLETILASLRQTPPDLEKLYLTLNGLSIEPLDHMFQVLRRVREAGFLADVESHLAAAKGIYNERIRGQIERAKAAAPLANQVKWQPVREEDKALTGKTFVHGDLSIYVSGAAGRAFVNNVHVVFLATEQVTSEQGFAHGANDVLIHGVRAAAEGTNWIVIAVPTPGELEEPNVRIIDTAVIEGCLDAIDRPKNIDRLRLTAHSRGQRNLLHTIGGVRSTASLTKKTTLGQPLVNMSIVEKVTMLDNMYSSTAHMLDDPKDSSGNRALPASKITEYHVGQGDMVKPPAADRAAGLEFIDLGSMVNCFATLGYVRLLRDGRATRDVDTVNSIDTFLADPANAPVKTAFDWLASRPIGILSTRRSTPPTKLSPQSFCASPELTAASARYEALVKFVTVANLSKGIVFPASEKALAAHHWFVAELIHETFE